MKRRLLLLLLLFTTSSAHGNNSVWLRGEARATGSGCQGSNDTLFIAYGDEADVIFNTFNISLIGTGDSDGGTSARVSNKGCKVSIPLVIPQGKYLQGLDERLDFGIVKSEAATGSFESRAWLHGWTLGTMALTFGPGELNAATDSQARSSTFDSRSNFCGQRNPNGTKGFYNNQMSMAGRRPDLQSSFILAAQGLSLKWHIAATMLACN